MFYDKFLFLCEQKGVSPSHACVEMGLSRSLAAKWKNTQQTASAAVLPILANYFGVSISYLLSEEKELPKSEIILSDDEVNLVKIFRSVPEVDKKMLLDMIFITLKNRGR